MRSIMTCSTKACLLVMAAFCTAMLSALGDGNIDATNKYAWAENAGWFNFSPTNGGVTITWGPDHLSGYAWAENIGWLKLGNDNGGPYQNTGTNDWGVNIASGYRLAGYAWSENCGWIKFNPTHSQATINIHDGRFDGYAWAENIGWIHFKNASPAYNVQTTARPPSGTVGVIR